MFTDNVKHVLWLDNSDTGDKFVFSEAYGDDRNSPYTIIDCVRINEIITDASGLRSYKLPQEEANRIEWLLGGGDNSDIDCDDELVQPEKLSDEDASEPQVGAFSNTLTAVLIYNQTCWGYSFLIQNG